jgi:mannose-6-phosphate isomerase-like protein (cupin superfamily)
VFRIVDFPPLGPEADKLDNNFLHHQLGGEAPKRGLPPRHPFMHRTKTIDYAIIMEGEIDMLLDDSEIHMKAGDVLVQQGTNHAWVNRGKEPCRIAFILIDSKEPYGDTIVARVERSETRDARPGFRFAQSGLQETHPTYATTT